MHRYTKTFRLWSIVMAGALIFAADAAAQMPAPAPGRIVGRVLDGQTGNGLSAVTIQVLGTPIVTVSGLDGRFAISNVPAGKLTLRVSWSCVRDPRLLFCALRKEVVTGARDDLTPFLSTQR